MSWQEWIEDIRSDNVDKRNKAIGNLYVNLEKELREKHLTSPLGIKDCGFELLFNDRLILVLDYALEIREISEIEGYRLPTERSRISQFVYPENASPKHIRNRLLKWINETWQFRYAVLGLKSEYKEKRFDSLDRSLNGDESSALIETIIDTQIKPKINENHSEGYPPQTYTELLAKIKEQQASDDYEETVSNNALDVLKKIIECPQNQEILLQFCHRNHPQLNACKITQLLSKPEYWHSGKYKSLAVEARANINVTMLSLSLESPITRSIVETWLEKKYFPFITKFLEDLDGKGELDND